ncbi:hypothetical protein K490DRAFT_65095 [Saccharata proteae CBS 121410]|uniref:Uncharacterized protein n=1 Tax=Saccharata proteae CBS 121410 TaxID=1314787 RepID=A0A9P4HYB9_9PEZI|nr:hypothetical protein K490DRAFT_65095 [Saccharata proteae CBS 121410]
MSSFVAKSIAGLAIAMACLGPVNAVLIGQVQNLCAYPVYVKTCRGDSYDSQEMFELNTGEWYTAPVGTIDNSPVGGVAVKVQTVPDITWKDVYQIEYAVGSGKSWWDQSAVNGDPLNAESRVVTVGAPGQCPTNVCAPYQSGNSCQWDLLLACENVLDTEIVFTIC